MKELRLLAYFHSPGGGGGREKITLPPEKSKKKKVDEVEKERGGVRDTSKEHGTKQQANSSNPDELLCLPLY